MEQPAIRAAETDDLPRIVAIYNEAVAERTTADLEPVSVSSRRDWLASHDPSAWPVRVAVRGGDLVGWSSLSPHRPGRAAVRRTAEVSYYVAGAARRGGVGRALLDDAIRVARALGFRSLFAILLEDNAPSVALLERFGFERWGLLPDVAELPDRTTGQLYYGRSI